MNELSPRQKYFLKQIGKLIGDSRKEQGLDVEVIIERAGISRTTFWAIEKGAGSVSIGKYLKVISLLDLEDLVFVKQQAKGGVA